MPFSYTSGNPDNLTGGGPARMIDIQGPLYDLRTWLNSATGGGGGGSSASAVLTAAPILDVGMLGQCRAGRQLTPTDFTSLGLQVPLGLWNLGDLTDVSGNGRVLSNKGSVPFGTGINGIATTAAVFSGSTGQALYIADTGASDPFRIRTGSWGCWFRTAKRGAGNQALVSKISAAAGNYCWQTYVGATNTVVGQGSVDGTTVVAVLGVSDVADDRWHFGVITADGTTLRVYVDGVLEGTGTLGPLFTGNAPLNIGGTNADASVAAGSPHYGRVDEAFVTNDVLSEDQIRCLYAAKLTHTLGVTPTGARLNVHRRRKGPTLAVADFTTQPLRLYNFTQATIFNDEGSNGLTLNDLGGTGSASVVGADGAKNTALSCAAAGSAGFAASDAGLPSGTAARSYGCWFKTTVTAGNINVMAWGQTVGSTDARLLLGASALITAASGADQIVGPFVADGQWHQAVVTEDNASGDGVRRKLYLDGRLVGGSTVLNAITPGGGNFFRIAANSTGGGPFTGQIDGAFVTGYALSQDEVLRLYAKGAQDLGASPKNAGDHVERVDASSVLFIGDTLESQSTVDLGVVA